MSGFVRLPDGSPPAGARVRLRDTERETVADEHGRYVLVELPAGTFVLEARTIGFVPIARVVAVSATRPATYDIRFDSAARILATIEVRAKKVFDRSMQEFDAAKRHGFSIVLGPDEIETMYPFDASDLLRGLPGVEVDTRSFGAGRQITVNGGCVRRVVDGALGFGATLDELVSPTDIAAMAAYRSSTELPAVYQSMSNCGAIVVWTKHGAPMREAKSSR